MARVLLTPEEKLQRRKQTLIKYREKHKEKLREYALQYQDSHKDVLKEKRKEYRQRKPYLSAKHSAEHFASKLQRTVLWDKELTDFVLEEAHHLRGLRDCVFSFKWDVDHIIPLRGKLVSGLHVWNNFAVIPATINRSKRNEYSIPK